MCPLTESCASPALIENKSRDHDRRRQSLPTLLARAITPLPLLLSRRERSRYVPLTDCVLLLFPSPSLLSRLSRRTTTLGIRRTSLPKDRFPTRLATSGRLVLACAFASLVSTSCVTCRGCTCTAWQLGSAWRSGREAGGSAAGSARSSPSGGRFVRLSLSASPVTYLLQ